MKAFLFLVTMIVVSCANNQTTQAGQKGTSAVATNDSAGEQLKVQSIPNQDELPVTDTGQTWFRVKITKNGAAWMDYEGSWPVFFLSGNSATVQLSKSKQIMGITDILTIYLNGMPQGTVPVVSFNRDKQTVSMIMSPVTDGAYGLAITASEGKFTITKNVNEIVSGNFEAKGIDLDKDVYIFKGYFLNAKINPEKI